jgi:hypothetical protein
VTPRTKVGGTCAACPVWKGECPDCGTFWIIHGTKRYGVRPTKVNPIGDTTAPNRPVGLHQLPNVTGPLEYRQ